MKNLTSKIQFKEGQHVSCIINSREVKSAKLHQEGGKWYICQNIIDGSRCRDRLGYLFSYEVFSCELNFKDKIEHLRPTCVTIDMVVKGDEIATKGMRVAETRFKVLARVEDVVMYDGGGDDVKMTTVDYLKKHGYFVVGNEVKPTVLSMKQAIEKLEEILGTEVKITVKLNDVEDAD